jgi:hypothetical protein
MATEMKPKATKREALEARPSDAAHARQRSECAQLL